MLQYRWTLKTLCLVAQSCPNLWDCMDCSPPGPSVHGMDSLGKNTGVDCHALLQGILPTQGLNPGLPHCRQILHHLSHQGSPRILERVAYPFSRGSFWPRNRTRVFCIAGGFFTNWATREALTSISSGTKWITITQSSSDTNYPELTSDSRFKASVPQLCLQIPITGYPYFCWRFP